MDEQGTASGNYSETSELITPNILRGLGDRSYDKRKASALELTSVIRTFQVCLLLPHCSSHPLYLSFVSSFPLSLSLSLSSLL
jgi:hypothetical protein